MNTKSHPLSRFCNPTAVNISICNAILRTASPDTRCRRITNPTKPRMESNGVLPRPSETRMDPLGGFPSSGEVLNNIIIN